MCSDCAVAIRLQDMCYIWLSFGVPFYSNQDVLVIVQKIFMGFELRGVCLFLREDVYDLYDCSLKRHDACVER